MPQNASDYGYGLRPTVWCAECGGVGHVEVRISEIESESDDCPKCRGAGDVPAIVWPTVEAENTDLRAGWEGECVAVD